ncbi:MAG: hypothetical protein AAFP84_13375, partial [Actinomycetota bacterium]
MPTAAPAPLAGHAPMSPSGQPSAAPPASQAAPAPHTAVPTVSPTDAPRPGPPSAAPGTTWVPGHGWAAPDGSAPGSSCLEFRPGETTDAAVDGVHVAPRNPRRRRLAVAAGVVGVVAAGTIGVAFVSGGAGSSGGASTPEDALTEMVEAINQRDPLAAVDLMAPDELSGADAFVDELIPYLEELGDELGGDLETSTDLMSDLDVEYSLTAGDVSAERHGGQAAVVSFTLAGEGSIGFDSLDASLLDELAPGMLPNERLEGSFDPGDLEDAFPTPGNSLELITVQVDGRWYISPFLTAGHWWVTADGLPAGEFDQVGVERPGAADTPSAAVEQYYAATLGVSGSDDVAGMLGGGEGRFFHVFSDAIDQTGAFDLVVEQDSGLDLDYDLELTELDDGKVRVDRLVADITDGESSTTVELEDGCLTFRSASTFDDGFTSDFEFDGCFSELFPAGADVDDTLWFQTLEEDGGHRVVVLPTLFDMMSRFVGPYDADVIRMVSGQAHTDDPTAALIGTPVDIEFAGHRYDVYEFEVSADKAYAIDTGGHEYEVYVSSPDGTFFRDWLWND